MSVADLKEVRVKSEQMAQFLVFLLRKHHQEQGDQVFLPVPDLAVAAGMVPDAVERLLKDLGPDQVTLESCKLHGFDAPAYRRNPGDPNKGWYPAVRLIPEEVREARRRALAERQAKLDRASHVVNEAFRIAYGADLGFRAEARDDGRVHLLAPDGDAEVLPMLLRLDQRPQKEKKAAGKRG